MHTYYALGVQVEASLSQCLPPAVQVLLIIHQAPRCCYPLSSLSESANNLSESFCEKRSQLVHGGQLAQGLAKVEALQVSAQCFPSFRLFICVCVGGEGVLQMMLLLLFKRINPQKGLEKSPLSLTISITQITEGRAVWLRSSPRDGPVLLLPPGGDEWLAGGCG